MNSKGLVGNVPGYFVCLECCADKHDNCTSAECKCCHGGKGSDSPKVEIKVDESDPTVFHTSMEMTPKMLDTYMWNRQVKQGATADEVLKELIKLNSNMEWEKCTIRVVATGDENLKLDKGREYLWLKPSYLLAMYGVKTS